MDEMNFFNPEDLADINEELKEMEESEIKTGDDDPEMDADVREEFIRSIKRETVSENG